jgi:hypothetical protein
LRSLFTPPAEHPMMRRLLVAADLFCSPDAARRVTRISRLLKSVIDPNTDAQGKVHRDSDRSVLDFFFCI